MMGPCNYPNDRIGLVGCGDGIPAFASGTHSLKPWMLENASLPPGARNKAKNILLWMLMNESIKPVGQRKYFDFSVDFELDDLFHKGINGVKIKIFTLTMDTKGREEVSGMQTCQAYQGCPVCLHSWSAPLSHGCVCDGFRRFLPPGDPGRQRRVMYKGLQYEYKDECLLPEPKIRDQSLVQSICSIATAKKPVLGHKVPPVVARIPGFRWRRILCTPEAMHDAKNCADNFVRLLVGKVSNTGYSGWSHDNKHRSHCETLGIFEDLWTANRGDLPWRLTSLQRKMLSKRMSMISWPHYMEPLYYRGASFWDKPGHMWKARRKYRLLFFVLVTQLRDQVPKFRNALLLFVWSIRRLMG